MADYLEEQTMELCFDAIPEEDFESFDGVSRVEELENILGEILDLWDEDLLIARTNVEEIVEVFDRAGAILANDPEEYSN